MTGGQARQRARQQRASGLVGHSCPGGTCTQLDCPPTHPPTRTLLQPPPLVKKPGRQVWQVQSEAYELQPSMTAHGSQVLVEVLSL